MSRASSYLAFPLTAPILAIIFIYTINQLWLQPTRTVVIVTSGASFYAAIFILTLLSTMVFSMVRIFARPVGIAFTASLFTTIYAAGTGAIPDIGKAILVFIVYLVLITVAVGLADGFIKGYQLKGVRGR